MEYNIKMNDEQVGVMIRALDLFMRVGIGQLEIIEEEVRWYMPNVQPKRTHAEIDQIIGMLKQALFGLHLNASKSICNEQVQECYREAYDILQVLRHRISWDRKPEGDIMSVWFDKPMKCVSGTPMVTIEKIGGEVENAETTHKHRRRSSKS